MGIHSLLSDFEVTAGCRKDRSYFIQPTTAGMDSGGCLVNPKFFYNTCSTSVTSGISSIKARSIPAFKVMVELGQLPQAPRSRTFTTPSSMSTNSTSPPSR